MTPLFFLLLFVLSTSVSALSSTEKLFVDVPSSINTFDSLKFITSIPHVAGTEGDFIMADFVLNEIASHGLKVERYDLEVLLNYPTSQPSVSLISAADDEIIFSASMSEDTELSDRTSDTMWRNHTFHGYSPSGSVKSQYVYANYGRPKDLDALQKAGVSVDGKIVITRYGECFRGLKVMNAQALGAVGVIVYSDPQDDGFSKGAVYPDGPWRSSTSVQRGSVQFNSLCAGVSTINPTQHLKPFKI